METQVKETQVYNKFYNTAIRSTNLKVDLVYVTPKIAKEYLNGNTINRKKSDKHIRFLTSQMKNGLFIENGESIVFDEYGNLNDGQHRLYAIIAANKSYYMVVVTGVKSQTIATYDTGKNRSAADVLAINGYSQTVKIAALIRNIDKYTIRKSKSAISSSFSREDTLTNQQILDYCQKNYVWLYEIVKDVNTIYLKQNTKVITATNLALIVYLLGGKNPSIQVYDYIKNILGIIKEESSATSYLYNKLYNAKINKEPLNFYWLLGMAIKAWNFYTEGNPAVRYYKFNTQGKLPKININ
tara:strand:- start:431 stop:1324 length:894 start_codon:yes stop_codon:yes gene_type:complete